MIHRLNLADGSDLGRCDHGAQRRVNFTVTATGTPVSLSAVTFNPATGAHIDDCAFGAFARNPSCWNFADFRRRVWGLGVRRGSAGYVRFFYALWGSQGFGAQNVMVVAERGGVRNLGLEAGEPFAYPHESRVLRYRLDKAGIW